MNQLQTQIKSRNPQMFKQFEEMQKGNPQEILNQIIKPEQKEQFIKYAKGFGISEEQINKVLTR
jgi:hypothetical protein